jgi:hypothetical protein
LPAVVVVVFFDRMEWNGKKIAFFFIFIIQFNVFKISFSALFYPLLPLSILGCVTNSSLYSLWIVIFADYFSLCCFGHVSNFCLVSAAKQLASNIGVVNRFGFFLNVSRMQCLLSFFIIISIINHIYSNFRQIWRLSFLLRCHY